MTLRTRSRQARPASGPAGSARVMAQTVTALLVAALLVAGSGVDETAVVDGSDLAPAATDTCADLLVLGIDGNGQGRKADLGAVAGKVAAKIETRATRRGRTVEVERVRLSTPGAAVLLRSRRGSSAEAVSAAGLTRWKKPVRAGVKATRAKVNSRLAACPEQQVALVGYAQGAAVVHRVLRDLDDKGSLTRVAGAVTVSDPLRVKKSSTGRPLGDPGASRGTEGLLSRFGKPAGDVPAATGTFEVVSVCHRGDLVCNPGRTAANRALALALSYAGKRSRSAVQEAADRIADRASLWPAPASQQLPVSLGQPFSHQLQVSGGSPTVPPARWTATALPAGVTLSPEGVLTGQLDTPGYYEVRYTVAGVDPPTTAKSGVVVLVVSAVSGGTDAGGQTSCAVKSDGTAWCWGRNDYGQVGDGTTTVRTNPAQVQGTGWARIATGGSFTCGVKTDGTLWCWGLNNFGQLGGADSATSLVPRQVGTGTTWKDVSAAWQYACATQADGSLWCWGQNIRGQLGVGKTSRRSTAPMRVVGSQQWSSVAAGGFTTCAVTTSGEGWCWGQNNLGQVGDSTTTLRVKPARVAGGNRFAQLATTWGRACGLTPSGSALCWGDNANGELGNGTRTDSTTPSGVAGGQTFVRIALGITSTCATRGDGQVYCWGDGRYGQLGPAGGSGTTTPVAAGVASTGAVLTAGWLHYCGGSGCWGANETGQLGSGVITPAAMPAEAAPPWGPGTILTDRQVRRWSAEKVARTSLASRPGVSRVAVQGRGARAGFTAEVMTFNVLGSQHTAPGGTRPDWTPGRVRSEWAKDVIEGRGSTLIGLSEPQPDQITALDVATRGAFSFYAGNTMGYDAAPQSVMWKDSEWEFVWGNTVSMPFMRASRPQALVRLRHRGSGRELYWVNAHLSPGKMQDDRDKGMAIIVALVDQLKADGLPILVTGDLNEHAVAFRRIACGARMVAAVGGVATKKRCRPPAAMRVDWIFGKGGRFSDTLVDVAPRLRGTTDHAVVSSRFTVQ